MRGKGGSLAQPVGDFAPGAAAAGMAMRRQPAQSAHADCQCAHALLDALLLLSDHKAEACLVHAHVLVICACTHLVGRPGCLPFMLLVGFLLEPLLLP